MDYKEKYNKLVEAVKVLQETNPSDEGIQNWVNDNVPELRESEDEKIRKELHIYLDWLDGRKDYAPRGEYSIRDMIAWLEKQGTSYTKRDVDDAYVEGMAFAKDELEKQGEQKHALDIEIPFGANDSELQEATYLIPKGFHAEIKDDKVLIKKDKQNPAWSKEDEWKFSDILALLRGGENCHYNTPDLFDWFKSLKNRIKRE